MKPVKTFSQDVFETQIKNLTRVGFKRFFPDYIREASMVMIHQMEVLADGGAAPYPLPEGMGGEQSSLNGVLERLSRTAAQISLKECDNAVGDVDTIAKDLQMEALYNIGYGGAETLHVVNQRVFAR